MKYNYFHETKEGGKTQMMVPLVITGRMIFIFLLTPSPTSGRIEEEARVRRPQKKGSAPFVNNNNKQ